MERDAKIKRVQFIDKSTDIREMFDFAHPQQVLQTVNTYSAHFYGAMLWDLSGVEAGKVFRSWNSAVKLAWRVPRTTHTYFVDHLLGTGMPSAREKLLSQYVGFHRKLQTSSSKEIRVLSYVTARNAQTVTGKNLLHIEAEFQLNPWVDSISKFKGKTLRKDIPSVDQWRLEVLKKLLDQRRDMEVCGEDVEEISSLINSLCSS